MGSTPDISSLGLLSKTNSLGDVFGGVAIVKEGPAKVKDGYMFKTRYLMLRSFRLDVMKSHDGKAVLEIPLREVTAVARSETVSLAFEITRVAHPSKLDSPNTVIGRSLPQKVTVCQMKSDDEIYSWIDAIYARCPSMGGVSNPTNFNHRVHVGFDPVNGSFTGLPVEWEKLLNTSAITKEDYQKNPQAVIEVLQFYSDINKRQEHPEAYPSITPTPPLQPRHNMQLGHGGMGTTITPPRSQPPINQMYGGLSHDLPLRSQNSTPVSAQRNVSGQQRGPERLPERLPHRLSEVAMNKLGMDQETRRKMEEAARKVKEDQDRREYQRLADEDRERRERDAYNASLPKKKVPMAQQEIGGGGYSTTPDKSSSDRYNPTRNAPTVPAGVLAPPRRQGPAPNSPPSALKSNGSHSVPRPPYAQQSAPSSREQSPAPPSALRRPEQQYDRHASPGRPAADSGRNESTRHQPRSKTPQTNGTARNEPSSRAPQPNDIAPLNVGIKQPTGAPLNGVSETAADAHKQAEIALTTKQPAARQKEVRMSSMTESQVMEKLKAVVSRDDPHLSYNKQKKIGQGASGSVYVARISENCVSPIARNIVKKFGPKASVAIKQMDLRNQPRKELIVNEIIVMKESSHPNIVNFLDSFLQENNNELWVVMEFMEGGALTDVIDNNPNITEAQISTICNEVSPLLFPLLFPPIHCPVLPQPRDIVDHTLTQCADMQGPRAPPLPKHHPPRHQIRQRPPRRPRQRQNHRFRLLRQTHGPEIQTRHHGRHPILDGPRSRQTEGIRLQSRHVESRHHGHRNDRVGTSILE